MIYQCFGFEDYNSVHLSEEFIMLKDLLLERKLLLIDRRNAANNTFNFTTTKGKLNATDSKSFLEGLQTRGEDEEKRLKEELKTAIKEVIEELGLATKKDIEALKQ